MTNKNPFTSETFSTVWQKHYNKEEIVTFGFIKNLLFFKPNKNLPLYINVGKNNTKGISYTINQDNTNNDYKGKVCLLYDVPQTLKKQQEILNTKIKILKVRQYPGYKTQLTNYKDFNDYLNSKFSKKTKYKFNSYKRALENTWDISYKNLYGTITKEEYDTVFQAFHTLLTKRFDEKQESNNNLDPTEWGFYKEVVYPLILEKKASLYVVYNGNIPIAISLNYFLENKLIFAMTVFDTDYAQYNVGTVHLMELYKWCFEQKLEAVDLSKGFYHYKTRWGDTEYFFENHIIYDANALRCMVLAHTMATYFKWKQQLRDLKINEKINKIKFLLSTKNQ